MKHHKMNISHIDCSTHKSSMNIYFLQWSCLVSSIANYGTACTFLKLPSTASAITVPANAMSSNVLYIFTISVFSQDGRSARRTVSVNATFVGSAQLTITSTNTRFNPFLKLILNSDLSANYALTANWSVVTAHNVLLQFVSLTSQSKSFSLYDTNNHINFPLSVDGGIFVGGNTYTFRLVAYSQGNSSVKTFTEMTLTANLAPSSGYMLSSPTNGSALVTQFLLTSPGWTADAANFPLSYAFSYKLSSVSSYLTLAASSLRPYISTTLPAGPFTLQNNLTLQTSVTDIYYSVSTATIIVKVILQQTTNTSIILTSSLKTAYNTGNINLVLQTVNNVSLLYICIFDSYLSVRAQTPY